MSKSDTITFPTPKHTDLLFKCPKCCGYHFNITHGAKLICTSVIKDNKVMGCGWSKQIRVAVIMGKED